MRKYEKIALVLNSEKRIAMLSAIAENDFAGYSLIKKTLNENGIPLVPSEFYKHITILMDLGLVKKKDYKYVATEEGHGLMNALILATDYLEKVNK